MSNRRIRKKRAKRELRRLAAICAVVLSLPPRKWFLLPSDRQHSQEPFKWPT